MRLLLLTFYYPPDLCAGSFRAQALTRALQEVSGGRLRIDVMTTMPNRYSTHSSKASTEEEMDGVTIRRIPLPSHRSGMFDQARAFASYARAVTRGTQDGEWDVVVATSSRLMTAVVGARIARRTGAALYLDIRDLFTDTMSDLLTGRALKAVLPAFQLMERRALRCAARVNLVSAGFLPYARQVAPWHEYRVFTNGIDEAFLTTDFSSAGRNIDQRPLIVYAGNMGDGQGLHNVIPGAAGILADKARFRLIGDGGRRRKLEDVLARSGVNNVEIIDPVPRTELYRHYKEADILFLHLNDHAAFRKVLPSKIFEYAATGKPILAGVSGHAAQFLKSEVSGVSIFPPCDVTGLVNGLDSLLQLPEYLEREPFRLKYARKRIMHEMAQDILALGRRGQ